MASETYSITENINGVDVTVTVTISLAHPSPKIVEHIATRTLSLSAEQIKELVEDNWSPEQLTEAKAAMAPVPAMLKPKAKPADEIKATNPENQCVCNKLLSEAAMRTGFKKMAYETAARRVATITVNLFGPDTDQYNELSILGNGSTFNCAYDFVDMENMKRKYAATNNVSCILPPVWFSRGGIEYTADHKPIIPAWMYNVAMDIIVPFVKDKSGSLLSSMPKYNWESSEAWWFYSQFKKESLVWMYATLSKASGLPHIELTC